ncbi:MAG: hypothetical protein MJ171_04395, partial [Clostridia bacterium]|nr:hypothetical protein [Clostridia bacterium]
DDEFVKLLEVENVNTVSEYRAFLSDYYLRVYREGYSMYLSLEMFERWMKESTFHIDMTEVENLFKLYHEEALKIAKRKNEETDMESEREDFNYYLYFALFLNRELDDFSSPVKLNSLMEDALKPFRALVEKHIKITLVEDN